MKVSFSLHLKIKDSLTSHSYLLTICRIVDTVSTYRLHVGVTKKAYNNIALLTYGVKTDVRLINLYMIGRAPSAVGLTLQAVNSTSIPTYDTRSPTLDLGLCRSFQWLFIIADVKKAILCADILQHYKLLVDVGNRRIMDTLTQLKVQGITSDEPVLCSTLLCRTLSNCYEAILFDFPSLTKPYNKEQPIKHALII